MTSDRPTGVRLIIAYKWLKALLQVGIAVMLFVGASRGLTTQLASLATALRAHAVHAWSAAAADALLRFVARPHDLILVATALAADAIVSIIEGWVLFRGYAWGPWVVVGATSSIIPFEIAALARHFGPTRFALLAINFIIVVYLVRRVMSGRRVAAWTRGGAGAGAPQL
jgi:uncharacterized membrane protein (DUF2068 family)